MFYNCLPSLTGIRIVDLRALCPHVKLSALACTLHVSHMDVACIRVFLWEREVLKMSAGRQFLRCLLHFLSLTDLFIMLAYLLVVLFYVLGVYARSKEFSSIDKRTLYGDPRRNITCLGSSYDLQLPIRSDSTNPNEYTMQQLCAKTIYGGAHQAST